MAINNFSTTVRIGDGQNAAQITTAGGAVQVEARSNYNTKFTVMSGVDDKVVADKQSFLKKKNDVTTDQVKAQCRPSSGPARAAVAIDDIRHGERGRPPDPPGGAVSNSR